MKENEVSVTFHADKNLMKEFDMVKDLKAEKLGLTDLTMKQALQLAIKESMDRWKKEKLED